MQRSGGSLVVEIKVAHWLANVGSLAEDMMAQWSSSRYGG
jgi:hypothetical protein